MSSPVHVPRTLKVAVVGCGDVARGRYLPYLAGNNSYLRLAACVDSQQDRARCVAEEWGIEARGLEDVLADDEIDMVLNLTPPLVHPSVNRAALQARKHVYSEKPFALNLREGRELQDLARVVGRRLASAPDTVLGPNIQLARRLIDEGRIGQPYMASFSFVTADRSWHPDPEFFFGEGAGPVFDEGPYFLAALVALLGPIESVCAQAQTYREKIELPDGRSFRPKVPTSYTGTLRFCSGALATMLLSFDVRGTTLPPLELYGEEGTLRLGFPGFYGGPVTFGQEHGRITETIWPSWTTAIDEARGIGVEELARAILTGETSRLEGDFPVHILECMEAIAQAAEAGIPRKLNTTTTRPEPYVPSENPRNRLPA